MHEERSKRRYSKTFSCAVIGEALQAPGHLKPPDVASMTWKSLNSTRPHWFSGFAATGVLNVYWNGIWLVK
jgi:hypothetical protein